MRPQTTYPERLLGCTTRARTRRALARQRDAAPRQLSTARHPGDIADHVGDSLALSRIADAGSQRADHRVLRCALHGRNRQDP